MLQNLPMSKTDSNEQNGFSLLPIFLGLGHYHTPPIRDVTFWTLIDGWGILGSSHWLSSPLSSLNTLHNTVYNLLHAVIKTGDKIRFRVWKIGRH